MFIYPKYLNLELKPMTKPSSEMLKSHNNITIHILHFKVTINGE